MAHTYAGTATYPANITCPDDGDARNASSVNVPLEGLADRAAYLKSKLDALTDFVGQSQAYNFRRRALAANDEPTFAAFDSVKQRAYVGYNNSVAILPYLLFMSDLDQSEASTTAVTLTGASAGEYIQAGDFDTSGNFFGTTITRYGWKADAGATTASRIDVTGVADTVESMAIAYDPVRAKWLAMQLFASVSGVSIRTSTDRSTWTTPTATNNEITSSSDENVCMACRRSDGRIVTVAYRASGTTIRVQTTDDCGTTFTVRTALTTTLTACSYARLFYADGVDKFILVVADFAAPKSEVWSSSDGGVTFTKVATLTGSVVGVSGRGPLLLAHYLVASEYRTIVSVDSGATWKYGPFRPPTSYPGNGAQGSVYHTPYGFIVALASAGTAQIYTSHAMGLPSGATVT